MLPLTQLWTCGLSAVPKDNSVFTDLLKAFHELYQTNLNTGESKHNVYHQIETKGQPIYSKARRLDSQKLDVAKMNFNSCWIMVSFDLLKVPGPILCTWYQKLMATGGHVETTEL
ncbi:hypothetical protein ACFFRR_005221 [Megaselia abdita]